MGMVINPSRFGAAEPAFWQRTVRVNLTDANGTQDIVHPSGLPGTPKLAIFRLIDNTADGQNINQSSGTSPFDRHGGSFGATDGTNKVCEAWFGRSANTKRYLVTDRVARLFNNTGTVQNSVDFTSWITDGVRVTNSSMSSGHTYLLTVEFYGGTTFEGAVGSAVVPTAGNTTVVTPGFEIAALLTAWNYRAIPANDIGSYILHGYASWDGSTVRQVCQNNQHDGGSRTTFGAMIDNAVIGDNSGRRITLGSITSTQFTLTGVTNATGSTSCIWVAMGGCSAWAGIIDSPTATGNQDLDDATVGFTPEFALLNTNWFTTTNTSHTTGAGYVFSITPINSSAQYCNFTRSSDNDGSGGTTGDWQYCDSVAIKASDHRAQNFIDATFVAFIADGMTLNFTNAPGSALKWPILFLAA